ncbi:hypothetical protein D3C87_1397540 [compost metagenome]
MKLRSRLLREVAVEPATLSATMVLAETCSPFLTRMSKPTGTTISWLFLAPLILIVVSLSVTRTI